MFRHASWVIALAGLLIAQDPGVIRIDTRLVQVNVVVHNKDGTPVADLTKDDFTLLDGGKPRSISFFSVDRNNAPRAAAPKLPPNAFANDPAYESNRPANLTIVLLDGANTKLADQSYARQQLTKFLNAIKPDDKVALYALGAQLRIVQDFTGDRAQLLRSAAKSTGATNGDLAAEAMKSPTTGVAVIDAILREMDAAFADQMQAARIRRSYQALAAIADHVAQVPGRKNLVWLSSAFPLMMHLDDPGAFRNARRVKDAFADERERATRALVKADVAIYPVDARGLIGVPPSMTADASSSGRTRTSLPAAVMKEAAEGIEAMDELAAETGGRAFHDSNDLAAAVQSAVDDSAVTYTLGFYPDPDRLDGKFHELTVKLKRKGVNVRFRKGYVAYRDAAPSPGQSDAAIQTALWSPLPATGIAIGGRAERAPNSVQLAAIADAHQLRMIQNADRWIGKLDVTFAQLDDSGRVLDTKRDVVNLHLDETTHAEIMKTGLLLTRTLQPEDAASQIRVILYDYSTGALGSLIIPLASVK